MGREKEIVVDDHCHIGRPEHYNTDDWVYPLLKAKFTRGIQVPVGGKITPEILASLPNPLVLSGEDVVKRMDESGVDKTVVVALTMKRWKTKVPNEHHTHQESLNISCVNTQELTYFHLNFPFLQPFLFTSI